jgi:hypothetical protein
VGLFKKSHSHLFLYFSGDLNDDCKVDFYDFAEMAANWLIDCDLTPENPACAPK